jgi:hypothetical protein
VSGADGLEVSGGVGGIHARTEDMEHAAALLAATAADVAGAGLRVTAVAATPALVVPAADSPGTFAHVEGAVAAAAVGPRGLLPAAARLELLGLRLRAAAVAYETTERAANLLSQAVDVATLGALGLTVAVGIPGAGSAVRLPELGSRVAGVVEVAIVIVPGSARQAVQGIGGFAAGTPALRDGHAVALAGPPLPVPAPTGVRDLLRGVASCYPEGGAPPGTVRVLRVTHPGGRRAWVVEIPGTQDWWPLPGPNPFDLTGDVASLAGRATAAGEVVATALAAAGARTGEPVLLAGHSLGGMVAAGLAADPSFRSRFTVTHVLTAGSPVADYAVPEQVRVLALEHTDDLVPALDGRRDPDRAGWVTVRGVSGGRRPLDPEGAHDVGGYVRTAALVDASRDPSIRAWCAGLAPFLAGRGVTSTGVRVVGSRIRRR